MAKKPETTSKEVAAKAAHVLKDPAASADAKSVAASALTQVDKAAEAKPKSQKPVDVSHNPAFLLWPTDVWGLTKDVKKAFVAVAHRVKGQPDKMKLLEDTLDVAMKYLDARYNHDRELRELREKRAKEEAALSESTPTVDDKQLPLF